MTENQMNEVLAFLAGGMAVTSILMWWFRTNLPIHILEIVRLVWKRRNSEYWSSRSYGGVKVELDMFTREDWENWCYDHMPSKLAELLNCSGCLSFHVSWIVSAVFQLVGEPSILLFSVQSLGWPAFAHVLLAAMSVKHQQAHQQPSTSNEPTPKAAPEPMPVVDKGGSPAAKAASPGSPEDILNARGIKFHKDEEGKILVDYVPRREQLIAMFLEGNSCPEEIVGCKDLKAAMDKEIEDKGGEKCPGCERNKIRNKYRSIITNMLQKVPGMD